MGWDKFEQSTEQALLSSTCASLSYSTAISEVSVIRCHYSITAVKHSPKEEK